MEHWVTSSLEINTCHWVTRKRAELREQLSDLKLLIIDEMSMVNADMLYKIDLRLKELFPLMNETPFAGIGVVLIGDLLQIPPVTYGNEIIYIFSRPKNPKFAAYHDEYSLWQLFEPMILRHNHRQGEGSEWADMLNRFRLGIVTIDDLALLQGRETDDEHLEEDTFAHILH